MIKFRTGGFRNNQIEEIEVERETANSVWVDGSRHAKDTSWHKYFDSWDAAHAYLLGKAESDLESARKSLERAQDVYGKIKSMKAP